MAAADPTDEASPDSPAMTDGAAPETIDGIPKAHYDKRWWTLAVLNLSLILIVLGNSVLNVALPTLVRELSATNAELQWIVDAYALVFGSLLLTMGALGDRFGRKGALQYGLVVFGLASVGALWATTPKHLIGVRATMGIGAALIMPATLSILTAVFPREERGKAMGIWAAFAGLGGAIGPVVGGWLLEHFAWPSIFALNLPVVGLALIAGLWLVPKSRDPEQGDLDPLGALLSIVTLTAFLFAVIEGPERGWTDQLVLGGFALSLASAVLFIWWERYTDQPMLPLDFFGERGFSVGTATISMTFFGMFAVFFVLTQYLQFVQGYTPLEAGIRTLPFAGGMMLGAPNSDRLARKVGTSRIVSLGLILLAGGLASFAMFQVDTPYLVQAPLFLISGLGMGFAMAPSTTTIMDAVPDRRAGIGSAVNDTSREVGGAVGIAVLGSILNEGYQHVLSQDLPATMPAGAREAATESVGAALAIARQVGGPQGQALADAARQAFVDGMMWTFAAGALMVLAASVLAYRKLPELDFHATGHGAPPTTAPAPDATATHAPGPANPQAPAATAIGGPTPAASNGDAALARTCHLCEEHVPGPIAYATTRNGEATSKRRYACPACYFEGLAEAERTAYRRERIAA